MSSFVRKLRHNLQLKFNQHSMRQTGDMLWCRVQCVGEILSHTSVEKDNFKGFGFVAWTDSVVSRGREGIILWLQNQSCSEVHILLHSCRLQVFKCNVNYRNQSNCCGYINSTNVCQPEGRVWSRHHVLRLLLTLHRAGPRRPCIIT